jgi:hypothetical protein
MIYKDTRNAGVVDGGFPRKICESLEWGGTYVGFNSQRSFWTLFITNTIGKSKTGR